MKEYVITLRRDRGGKISVLTTASSLAQAIKQVCDFEFAPESAVIETKLIRELF
jgi:hypothetical protein